MSDHAVSNRRSAGLARLLRGWIVAILAVVVAAGGHQAAHSVMHGVPETIPLQLLAFSAALTAPIAVALAGKRISFWSTASTTMTAQLVFHGLYSLPYTGGSTLPNGHEHHEPLTSAALVEAPVGYAAYAAGLDAGMLAAHLLAAALTTGVILYGERSLLALVHWLTLTPVRIVLAARPVVLTQLSTMSSWVRVWIPHPMNIAQTRSTRGPPVLA